MKRILRTSIAAAIATLLLAGTQHASAQIWQGVQLSFTDKCSTLPTETTRVIAQTFTAPSNSELRQIWVLANAQDGSGTDNANFLVVPWSDENSRPAGAPVFASGPRHLPNTTTPQTMTIFLPTPVTLTPGGRYAIIMSLSTTAAALSPTSIGSDTADPFPAGNAFLLVSPTTSVWAQLPPDSGSSATCDVGLQPAFTPPDPQQIVLLVGAKDGTGTPVNGAPGTTFAQFGIPAHNSAGSYAFVATLRGPDGRMFQAVCAGANPGILAKKGDPVAGRPGVFFSGFKDPIITESGRVFVMATVTGVGISAANSLGIYTANPSSGLLGVLSTGDEPAGIPGAKIKSFRSLAASDAGVGLVYQMVPGLGGVTTATDTALAFLYDYDDITGEYAMSSPRLRNGALFAWDLNNDGVFGFTALASNVGASGQGHGIADVEDEGTSAASAAAQVKLADGRTGNFLLRQSAAAFSVEASAVTGGTIPVYNAGATEMHQVAGLGAPGQSLGGASAFVMKSKTGVGGITAANDTSIVLHRYGQGLSILAREGMKPTGGGGAEFSSFIAPVIRHLGDTATHEIGHWVGFMAHLRGVGVTSANDTVICRMVGDKFSIVAREGSEAPGVPGSKFESFSSIAFMDNAGDSSISPLLAVAKLRTGFGGVTAAVDQGLWYFHTFNGDGHLVFREGSQLVIGGVTRTVKQFIVLPNVPFTPSQTRSHNAAGQIVLRAIFTDGTCALIKVQV